ncbi:hypothetical protein F5Y01DRAFT_314239 [Xylaria sp. FL0043]|nr:hypothetical protein F5Y01DRAFT_314239 [Xylaria sp. FL0043]
MDNARDVVEQDFQKSLIDAWSIHLFFGYTIPASFCTITTLYPFVPLSNTTLPSRPLEANMADGRERNPQSSSIFFLLPTELRIEVYRHLFSATRLTFGEWIRPKANSLALLRTCRRIEAEIDDMWIGHVLFNFCSHKSLYDKLVFLPIHIISKIRHIRVVDQQHPYSTWPAEANYLPVVLQQIPGLKLDRLTILGGDDHKSDRNWRVVRCASLDYLISLGSGWKELHYISRSGDMLASAPFAYGEYGDFLWGNNANVDKSSNEESSDEGLNNEGSTPGESNDEESNVDDLQFLILQPSHWQRVLETRDSALSGPSVVIYKSTKPNVVGSVMNPESREIYEQQICDPYD